MPVINIKEKKKSLRARFKKLRESCPKDVKQRLDGELTERFLSLEEYKNCKTLFAFLSMPIECDTHRIIEQAFADGKIVAVPKCINKGGDMAFYYIQSFDDLVSGMYGILEPDENKCEKVTDFSEGLCIVPGLCFDLQRYRIGFGKGYYDRFLNDFKGVTVGICFTKYMVSELPRGAHDRNTDILVTEKFVGRKGEAE